MEDTITAREAKHGEKMIEVKIRFWTDELSSQPGTVIPKHAWTSGVVRIQGNKAHGIVPGKPNTFNSYGKKTHLGCKEGKFTRPKPHAASRS